MHSPSKKTTSVTQSGRALKLDGVRIAGVYACVPKRTVANSFFEVKFGIEEVADVVKMIGVKERRWIAEGLAGSDLTLGAASALLERLAWSKDSIDLIIYVSQTPDYKMPATACILQHKLGLPSHCSAFDLNLGCSAYPYALWVAMSLLRASGLQRALLCVSETMSKLIDHSDRATALLFGDAATVTALETNSNDRTSHFILGTDGAGFSNLIIADGARGISDPVIAEKNILCSNKLYMDGWAVFNFTIGAVPKLVNESLAQAQIEPSTLDYFLYHQANLFMLDHLSKKSKVPPEKMLKNIAQFGNTSCASIPLLMATELGSKNTERPLTVAMIGFGVGYSWSSAVLTIDSDIPLSWIES